MEQDVLTKYDSISTSSLSKEFDNLIEKSLKSYPNDINEEDRKRINEIFHVLMRRFWHV